MLSPRTMSGKHPPPSTAVAVAAAAAAAPAAGATNTTTLVVANADNSREAIRERVKAQVAAAARSKVEEDIVMAKVKHGMNVHFREERQQKAKLQKERLDNAAVPGVSGCGGSGGFGVGGGCSGWC